jgi:putative protease
MVGEKVGRVAKVNEGEVTVATQVALTPGDGLCFFDRGGELRGTSVNAVSGQKITVQNVKGIQAGTVVYRNHDHAFLSGIKSARMERRIPVTFTLRSVSDGIALVVRNEDGLQAQRTLACHPEPAREPDVALATIRRQLVKTGQSIYVCSGVVVEGSSVPFLPVSALNALRRATLDALTTERQRRRPRSAVGLIANDALYPDRELTYLGNVLNAKAETFYRRHGVTTIEPAAESGVDLRGRKVMTTRYCIKQQLELCPRAGSAEPIEEPLYLVDDAGHRLRLDSDCSRCEMDISLE